MFGILIIILLMVLHGVFALIEIAFLSSRKVRLEEWKNKGVTSAAIALNILDEPEKFLSTVQFWITLLEIIAGVYGGATFADKITPFFETIPIIRPIATELSFIVVVGFISYLSIVVGDLVPKTIAISNPERFTVFFARFMKFRNYLG